MAISNIGFGSNIRVESDYRAPEINYLPKQEAKVASILKLQSQIVDLEGQQDFIKQTQDTSDLWKFNLASRLNII